MTMPPAMLPSVGLGKGPRDDQIDIWGVSHPGLVRKHNEDHFLICSLRRSVEVHMSNLETDITALPQLRRRLAFLAMVADGVGGASAGETASRVALEAVTHYLAHALQCYYTSDPDDDAQFLAALQDAAMQGHASISSLAAADASYKGMATTLTVWIGVWPRAYLLQVGDSRCYLLRGGVLTQLSRDQTMAQELIDAGVITRGDLASTRWSHVLSSALGGQQTAPAVTRLDSQWNDAGLLCSDGLTNHVSDERIREVLTNMKSAREGCETLLEDALKAGGTDNVSILIGKIIGS